jgi:hypothetical protein
MFKRRKTSKNLYKNPDPSMDFKTMLKNAPGEKTSSRFLPDVYELHGR